MADPKAGMLTQFNAGEFSSALSGRVDYQRLKSSLRKLVNGIPEVAGGIKKFYGTKYITSIPDANKFCLIPFHSEDGLFTLVLHDDVVDLIYEDKFVTLGLFLPEIKDYRSIAYEQANDVLICCCKDGPQFKIEYLGNARFRIVSCDFNDVPYFPFGYSSEFNGKLTTTGITGRIRVTANNTIDESLVIHFPSNFSSIGENNVSKNIYGGAVLLDGTSKQVRPTIGNVSFTLIRHRDGVEDVEVFTADNCGKNILDLHKTVLDNEDIIYYGYSSLTIDSMLNGIQTQVPEAYLGNITTFDYKQIVIPLSSISGHQSGDTYSIEVSRDASSCNASLVGEDVDEYTRLKPVSDGDSFVFDDSSKRVSFLKKYYDESGYNVHDIDVECYSSTNAEVIDGFSCDIYTEKTVYGNDQNLIGRKIKFYQNSESDAVKVWYQGLNVSTNNIVLSDGHYYRAKTSGEAGNIKPTHTKGVVSDGKVNWQYLHSGTSTGTIVSVESSDTMIVDLGDNILPIATYPSNPSTAENTFENYRWSMWGAFGNFPTQIFFANGRLGFICNTVAGTYYSLSCSDDYFNFVEDEYGKVLDTNSITGLISGGGVSNKINWVIAREKIYCGSYGAEFVIYSNNDVLTPTNAICRPVSFTGGDKVPALKYMTLSMFVGADGKELYSVNYDFSSDTYLPTNISYVSEHLLSSGIKKIVAAPRPDKTIYILTKDNKIVQFVNYVTEQVAAFSELNIGENIIDESVSYSGNYTGIYIARRENSSIIIERFCIDDPSYMLSCEDVEVSTLSRELIYPRFAGKKVYVKYNSSFELCDVDANGRFQISEETNYYTIGLPMTMEFHTQPISGAKLEGAQQAPVKIMIRLLNTGSFSYGTSNDYNEYIKFRPWGKKQEYSTELKLSTGDVELNLPKGYMHKTNAADSIYPNSTGVGLNFRSETPEPFNLLSISEVYK